MYVFIDSKFLDIRKGVSNKQGEPEAS